MFEFSSRSLDRMDGVHDDLKIIFEEALEVSPIDFGIPEHGGVRTPEVQHELFLKGVSKCDGFSRLSNHQPRAGEYFGRALDVFAYVEGQASWDKVHLGVIAGVILSTAENLRLRGLVNVSIKWGGTFGKKGKSFHGWDYPHFEISDLGL